MKLSDLGPRYQEQAKKQIADQQRRRGVVAPVYTLDLPYELPSLNQRDKQHWREKNAFKALLASEADKLCKPGIPPAPIERARIQVLMIRRQRIQDPDNLAAACKPLYDALQDAGILASDRMSAIGTPEVDQLTLKQGGRPAPATIVTITPLEEPA